MSDMRVSRQPEAGPLASAPSLLAKASHWTIPFSKIEEPGGGKFASTKAPPATPHTAGLRNRALDQSQQVNWGYKNHQAYQSSCLRKALYIVLKRTLVQSFFFLSLFFFPHNCE